MKGVQMIDLSQCRVLVVDDVEENIDVLLEALGDSFEVAVAIDGESALESVAEQKPDLILLDIIMPGLSGYEVCKKLKDDEETSEIPIIFLTVLDEEQDEAKGLALGGIDYITKPFNPQLVKLRVINHLELKKYRDHLKDEFRYIFDSLLEGFIRADMKGNILLANNIAAEMLGYDLEELMTKNLVRDIYLYHEDKAKQDIIKLLLDKKKLNNFEIILKQKSGDKVFAEANIQIINLNGYPTLIEATLRDVTSRKKNEAQLARLASVVEQSHDYIMITDTEGNIEYVNPAFEEITGYSESEVIGRNPRILNSGKHGKEFFKNIWETITSGGTWAGNITNRKKNGELLEEYGTIFPVLDDKGRIVNFVAIKRDITEHRKLENQLRQAQKMEAIGTLAGGIAHDFNNILSIIQGYTELINDNAPPDSSCMEDINKVLIAVNRAKDLVNQILTFSRQTEEELRPLQVQPLIKETVKFLRSSLPKSIAIKENIVPESKLILADPTNIHQVLMNLCTNAYHAMKEKGGTLGISLVETELYGLDNARGSNLGPGTYIMLEVSDTGIGIPKEIMENIFEPYFTTKDIGEGTGLGLSVVHGIVARANGAITVESRRGEGSVFRVYFPAADQSDFEVEPDTELPEKILPGGNEHILVVDDEEAVVQFMELMLRDIGYRVTSFTSSEDALQAFLSTPDDFDLVVTDQVMPDLTGEKLIAELLKINPDIPIILSTGFTEKISTQKALEIGVRKYLVKPFTKIELAVAVHELLGGNGNS